MIAEELTRTPEPDFYRSRRNTLLSIIIPAIVLLTLASSWQANLAWCNAVNGCTGTFVPETTWLILPMVVAVVGFTAVPWTKTFMMRFSIGLGAAALTYPLGLATIFMLKF